MSIEIKKLFNLKIYMFMLINMLIVDSYNNTMSNIDLIIKDYKKCKYDLDAICDMLGLKKSAYSERLKKAKEKKV